MPDTYTVACGVVPYNFIRTVQDTYVRTLWGTHAPPPLGGEQGPASLPACLPATACLLQPACYSLPVCLLLPACCGEGRAQGYLAGMGVPVCLCVARGWGGAFRAVAGCRQAVVVVPSNSRQGHICCCCAPPHTYKPATAGLCTPPQGW